MITKLYGIFVTAYQSLLPIGTSQGTFTCMGTTHLQNMKSCWEVTYVSSSLQHWTDTHLQQMSRLNCTTHFVLLLNKSPVQCLSPFYCVSLITVPPWISHSWTAVIAWKYPSILFNTGFATWMNELRMLSAVWIQIMKRAVICWLILTSSLLGIYYRALMIMVRCLDWSFSQSIFLSTVSDPPTVSNIKEQAYSQAS